MLTGLYDAKLDQSPVLAISGQVPSAVLGRGAFQDLDLTAVFRDVAAWTTAVHGGNIQAVAAFRDQVTRHWREDAAASQPENPDQLGTDEPDRNPVATARSHDARLPRGALCRHTPKAGAQCGNPARWDLRRGPPVRAVPTATTSYPRWTVRPVPCPDDHDHLDRQHGLLPLIFRSNAAKWTAVGERYTETPPPDHVRSMAGISLPGPADA